MKRILALLTIYTSLLLPVVAQQQQDMLRYRLAQNHEQQGEWESALPIYESLYRADPRNYLYFDGLRRTYAQLKEYDKAINLVRERMTIQQNDVALQAMLGTLYYQAGKEAAADSVWNTVIRSQAKDSRIYRLVASQMIENRLYDRAIQLYLRARAETGNKTEFAEELSWLYVSFQQYENATRELANLVRGNPARLGSVQVRLAAFTARDEGATRALVELKKEVAAEPEDVSLRTLLAWLHMEHKDYNSALVEYRKIDELKSANGQELFNFAQRALSDKAYHAAASAFREVIDAHPARQWLPVARYGYARAIEEQSANDAALASSVDKEAQEEEKPASETQPSYQAALTLYEAIINDYKRTEFAAQAYMRVGTIRRNHLFDLDGAIEAFNRARTASTSPDIVTESIMAIGEALTAKNDLASAREEYARVTSQARTEIRDRAQFRLAELDYFSAQFDSALVKIQSLTTNVTADLANDALQLQYFIQENKTTAADALAAFAKADLLVRQNKHSEAVQRFNEVINRNPLALLVDDAVMRLGDLYLKLKQPNEALGSFGKVSREMTSSIYKDYAQFRIGEVYELTLHDKQKAIEEYEMLLAKHPNSLYAEEARKRIRVLRGDNL